MKFFASEAIFESYKSSKVLIMEFTSFKFNQFEMIAARPVCSTFHTLPVLGRSYDYAIMLISY